MINIIIVDDNKDIREYFQMILNREPDLSVIATANSGKKGVELVQQLKPDVVLMDIQMESETAGIEATKAIKETVPDTKVIILTIHSDDEMLFKAYNAGIMDYITKTDSITQIISSIHDVYHNKLQLRSHVAEKIVTEFTRLQKQHSSMLYILNILTKLTNSEFEVLKCVYEGFSYKQIAQSRYVSMATIKSQVNSILKKFDLLRMKDVVTLMKEINFEEIYHPRQQNK
ncbi:MAG: response regulator transcription factor [Clostridiales bacterium]|nr:response regulator transcription factor [Clostridiales bacterium]